MNAELEADEKHFKSIRLNQIESWRQYKRAKNLFSKAVDRAKKIFFTDKLNSKNEADAIMKRIPGGESSSIHEPILKTEDLLEVPTK